MTRNVTLSGVCTVQRANLVRADAITVWAARYDVHYCNCFNTYGYLLLPGGLRGVMYDPSQSSWERKRALSTTNVRATSQKYTYVDAHELVLQTSDES